MLINALACYLTWNIILKLPLFIIPRQTEGYVYSVPVWKTGGLGEWAYKLQAHEIYLPIKF